VPGDVLTQQRDTAEIRPLLAVEHVEAGAFSRAVRADQRQDLAGLQSKGDAAHGVHTAIGFGQAFHRQQWRCVAHSADSMREASTAGCDGGRQRRRRFSITPTIPLGNATTISTMKAPSTSFDQSVWLTSQM